MSIIHMGGSINGGTPIAGWFFNMDDDWGDPYDSGKPHMDYSIHMHYSYGCFTKTIAITG